MPVIRSTAPSIYLPPSTITVAWSRWALAPARIGRSAIIEFPHLFPMNRWKTRTENEKAAIGDKPYRSTVQGNSTATSSGFPIGCLPTVEAAGVLEAESGDAASGSRVGP